MSSFISNVSGNEIEIIQKNPGPFGSSRENFDMINIDSKCQIDGDDNIPGWLRNN